MVVKYIIGNKKDYEELREIVDEFLGEYAPNCSVQAELQIPKSPREVRKNSIKRINIRPSMPNLTIDNLITEHGDKILFDERFGDHVDIKYGNYHLFRVHSRYA